MFLEVTVFLDHVLVSSGHLNFPRFYFLGIYLQIQPLDTQRYFIAPFPLFFTILRSFVTP